MVLEIRDISTINSPPYEFTLGVELDQFQRSYGDGYTFTIFEGFNRIVDTSTKNFSNFYLSDCRAFNEILISLPSRVESEKILTTLKLGNDYLKFDRVDPAPYKYLATYEESLNYGIPSFNSVGDPFTIEFFENNRCNIYYEIDEVRYYLISDVDDVISFVRQTLLSFDEESINPQDFTYIYSNNQNFIIFIKKTEDGSHYLNRNGNNLKITLINDKLSLLFNAFEIERGINITISKDFNSSFITYDTINNIDPDKSSRGLKNNALFHKKYHKGGNVLDAILLKNHFSQNDIYIADNALLSGLNTSIPEYRHYTSISETIKQEKSEDLLLNYTFNNREYPIKPGVNDIVTPDNMYPFSFISIHDTKFKESGAFPAHTPEFSDKIYQLSEFKSKRDNNQTLLCTWLSGSGVNSVWVDRYYYPDLTTKEESLSGQAIFQSTYDQYIEDLIKNNSNLKESVSVMKFFDKKSDMVFHPSKRYQYQRINKGGVNFPTFKYCEEFGEKYDRNYHTRINDAGSFNFSFYFKGDDQEWTVFSKRNTLDSGLTVKKVGDSLQMIYKVYNTSTGSFITIEENISILQNRENFFAISVDALNGVGYFILNNDIFNFKLPLAQFYKKRLLYGDIFLKIGSDEQNILNIKTKSINTVIISDNYVFPLSMKLKPIVDSKSVIDNIRITLPCGARNGEDNIDQLAITESNAFKSNNVNLHIKNIDIENEQILENLDKELEKRFEDFFPMNTKVINIKRNTYK